MSHKVVTFGEMMLRLATPEHCRFTQTKSFDATFGGAESNVAVSLAHFGLNVAFVTKVPNNPLGQAAINDVRQFGVNTDFIVKGGERLGIYFLEKGVFQRASKVVYDRKHSAISQASPDDFNWSEIFDGAAWFHWTGITPALSDSAIACVEKSCKIAKQKGVVISCDVNYRKKLWSCDKARSVLTPLMNDVDVCICNEEHAAQIFGIKHAAELAKNFGFKYVAITMRETFSASHNGWSGLLYDGKELYQSSRYNIHSIVDRVGGGDSFVAGLIYSLLTGKGPQESVEFAGAALCLKHTIPGDFNLVTKEEVELLQKRRSWVDASHH